MYRPTGFLILAAVISAGCTDPRPKTAVVKGTIRYNGKPLPTGSVTYIPTNAPAATSSIGPDGTYRLTTFRDGDGAVLGTHKVVVMALEQVDQEKNPLPEPMIPYKYTSQATTDLTADVKDEENTINFDLKGSLRGKK